MHSLVFAYFLPYYLFTEHKIFFFFFFCFCFPTTAYQNCCYNYCIPVLFYCILFFFRNKNFVLFCFSLHTLCTSGTILLYTFMKLSYFFRDYAKLLNGSIFVATLKMIVDLSEERKKDWTDNKKIECKKKLTRDKNNK